MIRYVILLSNGLSNLFNQDIENCIDNFKIQLKSYSDKEFNDKLNYIEHSNKISFNKKNEKAFIENKSGNFTIHYRNSLKENNTEYIFVLAHELAHFLFWHIHEQSERIHDPYLIPPVLGLASEILDLHRNIFCTLEYWESFTNYIPLDYDEELIANIFALTFIWIPLAKLSYIKTKKEGLLPIKVVDERILYLNDKNLIEFLKKNKTFHEIINNGFRFKPILRKDRHDSLKDMITRKISKNSGEMTLKKLVSSIRFVDIESISKRIQSLKKDKRISIDSKGRISYLNRHEKSYANDNFQKEIDYIEFILRREGEPAEKISLIKKRLLNIN